MGVCVCEREGPGSWVPGIQLRHTHTHTDTLRNKIDDDGTQVRVKAGL